VTPKNITAEDSAARLDVFLAAALGMTRSAAKRIIDHGTVERSGKRLAPHDPIRAGDQLSIIEPEPPTVTPPPDPRVIEQTEEFIVVEKPAGLLVHPAPGRPEPTLVDWLRAHDTKIAALPGDRPGIVHRLDRDVSGVMVIARTLEAVDHFSLLFGSRQVDKHYRALVVGAVENPEGEIDFPLAPSVTRPGTMAARPKGQPGREALTRYTVLAYNRKYSYLELELVTGRTHQLRAHLAAIAHPILGDSRYGEPSKYLVRPFLHATSISFPDLAGVVQTFHSPLPSDLAAVLAQLLPEAVDPVRGSD
jgi:23S rRNA pseudouridine1911/1915/1917 synthase